MQVGRDVSLSTGPTVLSIADTVEGEGSLWTLSLEDCRVSPSYGVALPSRRLVWRSEAELPLELAVALIALQPGKD